jgi:hypothetical protein
MYAVFVVVVGAVAAYALASIYPIVRDTTLRWAWWWAVTATVLAAGTELLVAFAGIDQRNSWREPLRFLATTATLTPGIAVLGCKRPQDVGWNFVVLALWGTVSLPAVYASLVPSTSRIDVNLALLALLAGVWAMQCVNYFPTNMTWGVGLIGVGQLLWMLPYLPGGTWAQNRIVEEGLGWANAPVPVVRAGGGLLLAAGLLVVSWVARPRRQLNVHPYNVLWLEFRDLFGSLWAVRLQQRMAESAARFDWKRSIHWTGFTVDQAAQNATCNESSDADKELDHPEMERTFKSLLRRFVTHDWIARRLSRS